MTHSAEHLSKFLEKQKSRLQFYVLLKSFLLACFLGLWAYAFLSWAEFSLAFVSGAQAWSSFFQFLEWSSPVAIASVFFYFDYRRQVSKISFQSAARMVEQQSRFFVEHPEHRSELYSAAAFLEKGVHYSESLSLAGSHVGLWEKRLENYRVELRPPLTLLLAAFLLVGSFLFQVELQKHRAYRFPSSVSSFLVRSFQVQMPFEDANWELKEGPLSGILGSKLKFAAPETGFFQAYLFLQKGVEPWRMIPCSDVCEFELTSRGRFAVGSLWSRSPVFPLQVIPDEEPKAVVFVEEEGELVPSATLNIENAESLKLSFLASDDIRLTETKLIHEFAGNEEVLRGWSVFNKRFKDIHILDLKNWEGGQHNIYIEASDFGQTIRSTPLVIFYADEEFLRQQRIASIQSLIDEWVHVLADLIESKADGRIFGGLEQRLASISYPSDLEESLFSVFVLELQKLSGEIQEVLINRQRFSEIDRLIERTEDKILYGLSLLFQEKAGDIQGAKEGVRDAQKDLSALLEKMKEGADVDSEALKEAFEKLQEQLQALQEKMRNLPRGPQDDLINREALDEQLGESEKLEDRIAEIQQKLAEGKNEEALRELESLINQLNILTKEIESSLEQWEDNLNAGAMQNSEQQESRLKEMMEKQESLAERTEDLEQRMTEAREDPKKFDEELELEEQEFKSEFEELAKEQAELTQEFNESSQQFREAIDGTEWEQVFNSGEVRDLQNQISSKMEDATRYLNSKDAPDASNQQREAVELLKQAGEQQQQIRQQVQQQAQQMQGEGQQGRQLNSERVEVIDSEGRGDKERRRKIMNSLKQKVGEEYQESHERYFEELLQR